jgi:transcriptional regulator
MYQPAAFREDQLEVQHALFRAHPLGLLITAGPAGLIANPFPCLIDSEGSDKGTLRLHIARANPQWRELEAVDECLVVFEGSQDYVTPSWYATKRETGKASQPGILPRSKPGAIPGWSASTPGCAVSSMI